MRSESNAIWTSGEPVSFSARSKAFAMSAMVSALGRRLVAMKNGSFFGCLTRPPQACPREHVRGSGVWGFPVRRKGSGTGSKNEPLTKGAWFWLGNKIDDEGASVVDNFDNHRLINRTRRSPFSHDPTLNPTTDDENGERSTTRDTGIPAEVGR